MSARFKYNVSSEGTSRVQRVKWRVLSKIIVFTDENGTPCIYTLSNERGKSKIAVLWIDRKWEALFEGASCHIRVQLTRRHTETTWGDSSVAREMEKNSPASFVHHRIPTVSTFRKNLTICTGVSHAKLRFASKITHVRSLRNDVATKFNATSIKYLNINLTSHCVRCNMIHEHELIARNNGERPGELNFVSLVNRLINGRMSLAF